MLLLVALAGCSNDERRVRVVLESFDAEVVEGPRRDIVQNGTVVGQFVSIVLRYEVVIRNTGREAVGSDWVPNQVIWLQIDPGESLKDAIPHSNLFSAQRLPLYGALHAGIEEYSGERSIPVGATGRYFIAFGPMWTVDTSGLDNGAFPPPTDEQIARIKATALDVDAILWRGNEALAKFPLGR